jgi:hypothetical protein
MPTYCQNDLSCIIAPESRSGLRAWSTYSALIALKYTRMNQNPLGFLAFMAAFLIVLYFMAPFGPARAALMTDGLIKSDQNAAVYYYAVDGKRYVFPNERAYFTWYQDFSDVQIVSSTELAAIPIGGNVTYRPGSRLVKIVSDPTVYAVAWPEQIRPIASETVAAALYGPTWNQQIDDVPDAFFVNYTIGPPIASVADYSGLAEQAKAPNIGEVVARAVPCGACVTPEPTPPPVAPPTASAAPRIGSCQIFPDDNPWNTDISSYPVHENSDNIVASISLTKGLHPDFGENPDYGIPFDVVGASQPLVPITFDDYGDESDPGPYPIPPDATVEAGSDRHVLVLDQDNCVLYEMYNARKNSGDSGWTASSGAKFDLTSNALRPQYWTSADAAGLPIMPGLVRYDEVQAGAINHAIRFTADYTRQAFIPPATHFASSDQDPNLPAMGMRFRLKSDFDISGFSRTGQVILTAMKKYGLIMSDNGGDWFFQGEKDAPWNDDELNELKSVPGSAFEVVYTGEPVVGWE